MKNRTFKPIHLDMLKSETEKDWKTAIREEINRYRAAHSKAAKKQGLPADYELELSGELEKRRVKALMDSLPEVKEKHPKAVIDWIVLNVVSESYAVIEENNNLLLAAAIWILDRLEDQDVPREELFKLLPRNENDFDDLSYPDIWDCRFEDYVIFSVEYVLRNRNRDVAPPESNGKDGFRVWTSTLAANGVVHSDTKSRQDYEKLIGMIPPEQIYVAVQHFKQFFNMWKERFFACVEPLCDETESIRKKVNDIRRKINEAESKADNIVKKAEAERKSVLSKKRNPAKAPFAAPVTDISQSFRMGSSDMLMNPFGDLVSGDIMSLLSELDELNDRHEKAIDKLNAAWSKKTNFCATLNRQGYLTRKYCEETYGIAVSSRMEMLPVTDPYELCFALLYLLEQDNDIPWLYGACIGLMEEVSACLPWGFYGYDETDDVVWNGESTFTKKPVAFPDWYERTYCYNGNEEDYPHNLAQLIYEETGCLMPRNLHKYDCKSKILGKFGIKRGNAVALLYCMDIMGQARRRMSALNLDETYMDIISGEKNEEDTEKDKQLSSEELQKRIATQDSEIQRLRSALHAAEKKAADFQKTLSREKQEFELERRELADLREFIFLRDNAEESEEEEPSSDIFPYDVTKETVVFGGHFTWSKAFKPLIKGNVRYVEAGANFDPVIIKNCDVVWIQNNAIPHSQYYKVINNARQYRKPVRYFRYASAVKCAEQLAESDSDE